MSIGLDQLDPKVLLLLAPLVLLELGLLIAAVADLLRDDRAVRGNNKGLWAVVIVLVNVIGPILYFFVGRVDGPPPPQAPRPDAMPGWGSPHDPPAAQAASPVGLGATSIADAPAASVVAAAPPAERVARVPDPGAPPAIAISGLTRHYPGGVVALDGLTMDVPAGSVFGLLGPNGAGKTTTLRLLAGLTRATTGSATVAGQSSRPTRSACGATSATSSRIRARTAG